MPDPSDYIYNGVNQGLQDWEKTYQNGKIADNIIKVNPEMLDQLEMSPEQFGAQSATDKSAAIAGLFQAQGAKQHAAMVNAQLQDYLSQASERSSVGNYRDALADEIRANISSNQADRTLSNDALDRMSSGGQPAPLNLDTIDMYQPSNPSDVSNAPVTPTVSALEALQQSRRANPTLKPSAALIESFGRMGGQSPQPNLDVLTPIVQPGPFPHTKTIVNKRTGQATVVTGPAVQHPGKTPPAQKIDPEFQKEFSALQGKVDQAQDMIGQAPDAGSMATARNALTSATKRLLLHINDGMTLGRISREQGNALMQSRGLLGTQAPAPQAAPPQRGPAGTPVRSLNPQQAAVFLKQAGGDKTKARALATQAGFALTPVAQ